MSSRPAAVTAPSTSGPTATTQSRSALLKATAVAVVGAAVVNAVIAAIARGPVDASRDF